MEGLAIRAEDAPLRVAHPSPLYLEPSFEEMVEHGRKLHGPGGSYSPKTGRRAWSSVDQEYVSGRVFTSHAGPRLKGEDLGNMVKAVGKFPMPLEAIK